MGGGSEYDGGCVQNKPFLSIFQSYTYHFFIDLLNYLSCCTVF